MNIATKIILTSLLPMFGTPQTPDLCDVVDPETGTPTICLGHSPEPPVLDKDLCCAGESCTLAFGTTCDADQTRYHCDYGELDALYNATCYFEVPDYCAVFQCETGSNPGYTTGGEAEFLCCYCGICEELPLHLLELCESDHLYWCESPFTNWDGNVGCADWD